MGRFVFLTGLIFLITACTTVDDYKKMNPNQRANAACRQRSEFKSMAVQRDQYTNAIAASQSDLSRGYKVHTQCRNVEVTGDASTSCNTSYIGNNGYTNCTESRPKETRQVCQETPVPINLELERGNLAQMQSSAGALDSKMSSMWSSCINYVTGLSAESAFRFSENR